MKIPRKILLAAAVSALLCAGVRLGAQTPEAEENIGTLPYAVNLKPFYSRVYAGPDGTNSAFKNYYGRKVLDGLPFDVDGEVVLFGSNDGGAEEIKDIKIARKFDELHLIHTLRWHEYHGCPVAIIRLHYADGTSHDFTLRYDVQVAANRLTTEETETLTDPNSKLIWRCPGPYHGDTRLFKTVLKNPFPDKQVNSMDAISERSRSSYVLVAATAAKSDSQREVTPALPLNQPAWHFDGVLSVRVVDGKTGKPIAGADVYPHMMVDEDGIVADPVLTGSNGVALVKYPVSRTGYLGVCVSKPGFEQHSGNWQSGSIPDEITYELGAAPKISGIVHRPDGNPAAGLPVQLIGYGPPRSNVKTDADGKFELDWNPRQFPGQGEQAVCILVRDVEHNLAAAQEIEEDTAALDLKLAPGLTLFGRAQCDGKPVTNVTAQLVFWSGNHGMWLQGLARTSTPGQYEIPALPPGRKYGVIVSAPGFGQKQNHNLEVFTDPGRQELDPVELKLANLKVSGQVLDADDKPVAGCYVNLNGENQPNDHVRADREGRFTFDHVCEGPLQLMASAQSAFGNVSAEGGDTNVVLRLGENSGFSSGAQMHKLKGLVTDADGQPAPGAQVAVFPNNGSSRWIKTGPGGEYSLNWSLQPWQAQNGGAYLVVRDRARNLAAVEELPEETTNLTVKLKPALTLTGLVKSEGDAPMSGAQVGLWFKAGNTYETVDEQLKPANADGRYEIPCLPADGKYMIWATAKGYGKNQRQVENESDTNRVELEPFVLKPANKVIAGQVLKDDDKPASGVNVNLSGEGQPDGYMTTDSKGRFHFQVCDGQINLYAYSQYGNGSAQANVEAGDTNIVLSLNSSSGFREVPRRASLKGSSLPDLTAADLAADAVPAGKPLLLCLFDTGQRSSRHVVQALSQQADALRQKNISIVGIQSAVISDDTFNDWKNAASISFPIGRITAKSEGTKWATEVAAVPWLILTDANHRVVAEGFSLGDLEAQVQKLAR